MAKEIEVHKHQVTQSVKHIKDTQKQQGITVLYLCGGIGTAAQALKEAEIGRASCRERV